MTLSTKILAYRCGALGAFHRLRNRGQLTVAMFHRVLPESDPRHAGADPEWTMTPDTFDGCLRFFRRHYRVVTPQQVFAALDGGAALPPRSLLITFDDGWADTAEYAQPLLAQHALPALIFVAGCAIDSHAPFWEERAFSVLATRPDALAGLRAALALAPASGEAAIRAVIGALGALPAPQRSALLDEHCPTRGDAAEQMPAMLDAQQLRALAASGLTIGGHGMAHVPLTRAPDVTQELAQAQACLSGHLKVPVIASMSFPHGAASGAVVEACKAAGYRHLFSSAAELVTLPAGRAVDVPIGRIHVSERAIRAAGRFQPALMATWMFLRPIASLPAAAGAINPATVKPATIKGAAHG